MDMPMYPWEIYTTLWIFKNTNIVIPTVFFSLKISWKSIHVNSSQLFWLGRGSNIFLASSNAVSSVVLITPLLCRLLAFSVHNRYFPLFVAPLHIPSTHWPRPLLLQPFFSDLQPSSLPLAGGFPLWLLAVAGLGLFPQLCKVEGHLGVQRHWSLADFHPGYCLLNFLITNMWQMQVLSNVEFFYLESVFQLYERNFFQWIKCTNFRNQFVKEVK